MLRFTTAGESHGRGLVAVLEGIPAGLPLSAERINVELKRRMGGYGRGARMKIEADLIEWLAGVRAGETLGSPIPMLVWTRDWEHWQDVMAPEADAPPDPQGLRRQVTRPRPGDADLAGSLKYDRLDARDILERASARETVARVACGAICKKLLREFNIEIGSHVAELGGVVAHPASPIPHPVNEIADQSPVRCLDKEAETEIIMRIDAAKAAGDTLGGIVEVIALGVPVGLGSPGSWDRKPGGRLAPALSGTPGRRPRASTVGALRCDGRPRDGSDRRGNVGDRLDGGVAREIRRRRAERAEAQCGRLSRTGARAHSQRSGVVKRHIVLIGLPGAGKSTVGRMVADKLHAGFVDIDTILIRKEGKPISMIFAEKGEPVFREMERKEVEAALANEPAVIAPGGGWAAQPGALENAKSRGYLVYLKARAEVAAGR